MVIRADQQSGKLAATLYPAAHLFSVRYVCAGSFPAKSK
jgi:hypothetical protein